jgi:hypothetical protein
MGQHGVPPLPQETTRRLVHTLLRIQFVNFARQQKVQVGQSTG